MEEGHGDGDGDYDCLSYSGCESSDIHVSVKTQE